MSIMDLLKQAQGGNGLGQLAEQFGLEGGQAEALTGLLGPVIGKATRQQAEGGGLASVLDALKGEDQAALFDDASQAASTAGQAQGQAFLDGILGGSASAGLAEQAAEQTGVDLSTVQSFLPALAAMAQGGLQKSMPDGVLAGMGDANAGGGLMGMASGLLGGLTGKSGGGSEGGLSMLTGLLDADGDGSIADDILGKIMR